MCLVEWLTFAFWKSNAVKRICFTGKVHIKKGKTQEEFLKIKKTNLTAVKVHIFWEGYTIWKKSPN